MEEIINIWEQLASKGICITISCVYDSNCLTRYDVHMTNTKTVKDLQMFSEQLLITAMIKAVILAEQNNWL